MTWIRVALATVRAGQWWASKAGAGFVAALILGVAAHTEFWDVLRVALIGLAPITAGAVFGFGVNDIADRALDQAAGKDRPLGRARPTRALLWLSLLFPAAIAAAYPLGYAAVAVTAIGFLVGAAYSLPPVRLKGRGFLGLMAATVSPRLAPVGLYAAAFANDATREWALLTAALLAWCLVVGLHRNLIHQFADAPEDARAGVRTFALRHDTPRMRRFSDRGGFVVEIAAFVPVIAATALLSPWSLALAVPMVLGLVLLPASLRWFELWWPVVAFLAIVLLDPRYAFVAVAWTLVFVAAPLGPSGARRALKALRKADRRTTVGRNS